MNAPVHCAALALALAALTCIGACGGGGTHTTSGDPAPTVDVTGDWSGPYSSPTSSGSLNLSLVQTGSSLTGSASLGGSLCTGGGFVGTVTGTVTSNAVYGTAAWTGTSFAIGFQGLVGTAFDGTYAALLGGACEGDEGSFHVSRVLPPTPPRISLVAGDVVSLVGGSFPSLNALALADFDKDGNLDVVVADGGDQAAAGVLHVLLGTGGGHFAIGPTLACGDATADVAVGDFDEDGNPDLVAVNSGSLSSSLAYFRGHGNGTFDAAQFLGTGANPTAVVVGDFDGDGHKDVVALARGSGQINTFRGNGNGTFQSPGSAPAPGVRHLAVADLNADGRSDLVLTDPTAFEVRLGLSNPFLVQAVPSYRKTIQSSPNPQDVFAAVGDFTGDGVLDVLAADDTGSGDIFFLYRGVGDGTFVTQVPPPPGSSDLSYFLTPSSSAVAAADLDGDGLADAVATLWSANEVAAALPAVGGPFTLTYAGTGYTPRALALGDVDGDGIPDVVVVDYLDGDVRVILCRRL